MGSQPRQALRPPNRGVIILGRMIKMRPFSERELTDRYLSWLNDTSVNEFLETRHTRQSFDDAVRYVNDLRSTPGCELFAVLTRQGECHVGNVSLTEYNPKNQGYAVYGLAIGDSRARMLGLGGEASALMVEYLFRDPAIRRIHEAASAANVRAWRTLESLGFQREGVLRQHLVLPSGKVSDVYVYGMLREEWHITRSKIQGVLKHMQVVPNSGIDGDQHEGIAHMEYGVK